jgi:hypothetical protein
MRYAAVVSALKVGDIVRHRARLEWGRGRVVNVDRWVHVFFEHLSGQEALKLDPGKAPLERLDGERVPLLEHLRVAPSGDKFVLASRRVSFDDLFRHFMRECPGGFADEKLLEQELTFKRASRDAFANHFGDGRGRALVTAGDASALTVGFGAVLEAQKILLSIYERAAFGDAMVVAENVLGFGRALFEFLDEPLSPKSFDNYVAALEAVRPVGPQAVTKWPILTLFPFLARPEAHAFLKPEVTKEAADIIGVDLKYDAALNWTTYSQLLMLVNIVDDELAKRSMRPRDHIETQSFIWVSVRYS